MSARNTLLGPTSVKVPSEQTWIVPILLPLLVNQRLPSGPVVMAHGASTPPPGSVWVVMVPLGVMRPMRWLPLLVNQRLPSGPVAAPLGRSRIGSS
jgi:hypothetical protein